ncbi:pilus assembly PilX family protein [Paludibacterium denitrificans]|uniref:Type IV pilus assembly protein PilX n=1 Tax=Paludibacterium denitrificans TaxID=2675226 RepID=A0A844GBM3_9NEIS|nr:PilX N-terminal domain-containing pilus assembly protein [Paludibacterium denitrificans]MTD33162.1 hypothetical protein [Paludibacterium denitrificans]
MLQEQLIPLRKQQGAALLVAVIMLMVITILVVYGSQSLLTEQKVASNQNDKAIAFQLAELALKSGETYVSTNKPLSGFSDACKTTPSTTGLCTTSEVAGGTNARERANVFTGTYANMVSRQCTSCTIGFSVSQQPRYIVELINSNYTDPVTGNAGVALYRITARARGRSLNTQVTLQSYYVVS